MLLTQFQLAVQQVGGVVLSPVKDLAFAFIKPHKVPGSPFLLGSLNGSPILYHTIGLMFPQVWYHPGTCWGCMALLYPMLLIKTEQYQPQYQPPRDSISYRLPLELCTADHNPLRPMVPLIFHLLYSPPDKSVFHQVDYRDNMGDHAEGFAKVQVNNIHCSPHVHWASHLTVLWICYMTLW